MDLNNLEKLTQLNGVSGREDAVRAEIAAQLQALGLPAHTDVLGNLIAYRKGTGPHKIILCAHMDEVGLMVKYISPDGFLSFITVGGIDPRTLLAQRVTVHTANSNVTNSETFYSGNHTTYTITSNRASTTYGQTANTAATTYTES